MTTETLIASTARQFQDHYGTAPGATAFAPGRVNLLGEHTDYNGGYVLPMPLMMGTAVALGRTNGTPCQIEISSAAFEETIVRSPGDAPNGSWTDYVLGSLMQIFDDGAQQCGWQVHIDTNLPVGSGLSSSAALEVALMRAYCALTGAEHDPVTIAQMARAAENNFVGMPCGIMDQYSVSVGTPGSAVFLDTRALLSQQAPTPDSHHFVIVHSGVGHKLTDDGYATRVAECKAACAALKVESLSDLGSDDLPRIAALDSPLNGRAKHIVTENARVQAGLQALKQGNTAEFAQLMVASHISQRDDYAVSVPEVDALVDAALAAGADGARLTGGGFGGSVVALVEKSVLDRWCSAVEIACPKARVLAIT